MTWGELTKESKFGKLTPKETFELLEILLQSGTELMTMKVGYLETKAHQSIFI